MAILITVPTRVYLLSPHSFVREELSRWLAPQDIPCEKVALPYSLAPRADRLVTKRGSVCVVDACFPPAGTESLVSSVLVASPEARVLVLAEELAEDLAFPLLRLGVKGLVTYGHARRQLLPALAAVCKGGYWVPRGLLSRFVDVLLAKVPVRPMPNAVLSRREQDVLEALLQNQSNKEIAVRLNISERTVKFHVSNLLAKFSVQRRADLILHSFQARTFHAHLGSGTRADTPAPPRLRPPRAVG